MSIIRNVEYFRPLKKQVFVTDLEYGARLTKAGIIKPDDDMTNTGIRDRWAKVWAVGPEVDDLKPGNWVLVKSGRWTNHFDMEMPAGVVRLWRIEHPESTLLACDECPLTTEIFKF